MQKVVVFQGSSSDNSYVDRIVQQLQTANIPYDRRIASAHRTSVHLQRLLDSYEESDDDIIAITVAGMSDALSGTVATRLFMPTIACPPDAEKYGEVKKFSSTKIPSGEVHYTQTPEESVAKAKELLSTFDFSQKQNLIAQYRAKCNQVMMEDARLQGADNPLPYTLWKVGKVRDVYDLDSQLLINSSDRISAFDEVSVSRVRDKGMALNLLSSWWFDQTKKIFPNHYLSNPDVTMMLGTKAKRIDLEFIARGYLYGSMARDYEKGQRKFWGYQLPSGMQLAQELPEIMLTPTTKADKGHDMPITREEAVSRKLVTADEWNTLHEATLQLFGFYQGVARQKGLIIPDFKLEFGRYDGGLIQIDEAPDHDSARIWNARNYQVGKRQEGSCLDKEFYRQYLLDSGIDSKNPPHPLPEIPGPVTEQISLRALGAYQVLAKDKSIDSLPLRSLEDVEQELGIGKV